MDSIEKTGRTAEEAIEDALRDLGASREEVEIDVISEEQKSRFLGLRSQTEVRVRVTRKEGASAQIAEGASQQQSDPEVESTPATESELSSDQGLDESSLRARDVLEGLLQQMGVEADLEIERLDSNDLQVNIVGDDLGFLIGKHGQTLYSIQYLVNTIINRHDSESTSEGGRPVRVLLDSGGYRERRLQTLQSIARNTASKARARGRRIRLDPLPSHERRIIHMTLADDDSVKTFSEGRDPHRYVIIEPAAPSRPRVVDHERRPSAIPPRPKRTGTWGQQRPTRQPFDSRLFDDMFAEPKSPPRKPGSEGSPQEPSKDNEV